MRGQRYGYDAGIPGQAASAEEEAFRIGVELR
ncbi:DUF5709 domain-containing protein [Brevibacillus marinus]